MNRTRRRKARPRPSVESLEGRALMARAGALDPGFGGGRGFVALPGGVSPDPTGLNDIEVGGVAVQPDGKVVVGSIYTTDARRGRTSGFLIQRTNADGSPDPTFGDGGSSFLSIPSRDGTVSGPRAVGVFLQPDGKILLAGDAILTTATTSDRSYVAFRITSAGVPDPSFDVDGVVTDPTATGGSTGRLDEATAAALGPDGKLILAGSTKASASGTPFAAVRLNADGSVDTAFGTDGTAAVPVTRNGFTGDSARGVAVQPDGRIVLAGTAQTGLFASFRPPITIIYSDAALVRLNADGTPDSSFGGPDAGGTVLIASDPANPSALGVNLVESLAVGPDGKLLLVGTNGLPGPTETLGTLTRLNPDGTLDLGFGPGGRLNNPFGGPAAIQADGKIVLAGEVPLSLPQGGYTRTDLATRRLNADGMADATYGNTDTPGQARYRLGSAFGFTTAGALAIGPGGNLILAGTSLTGGLTERVVVARVLAQPSAGPGVTPPPPPPPADFDGSGRSNLAVYLPNLGAFAYRAFANTQFANDPIIPFGIPGAGQTVPAAADYEGIGQTQIGAYLPAFGLYATRPSSGPDRVVPFGIPGAGQSIPAPADYDGDGKADLAVYLPSLGAFGVRPSSGGPDQVTAFGIPGAGQSIPAPADYDGDGKADLAVYLAPNGAFAVRPSTGGPDQITLFGLPGVGRTIPVPGDYSGLGRAELAAYFPEFGAFAYRPGGGGADVFASFFVAGDGPVPVPGDYSGSGRTEFAIYNRNAGAFAYRPAGGGTDVLALFGSAGVGQSIPVAAPVISTFPPVAAAVAPAVVRSAAVPGGPMAKAAVAIARRSARPSVLQAKVDPAILTA